MSQTSYFQGFGARDPPAPGTAMAYYPGNLSTSDQTLTHFDPFASPESFKVANDYRGHGQDHYNATKAYNMSMVQLGTVITGQIVDDQVDRFYTSVLLPIKRIPGAQSFTWNTITFLNAYADIVPYEGVPKLLQTTMDTTTESITRRAIGLFTEHSYLATGEGKSMYEAGLRHIACVVADTMCLDVIYAYINCKNFNQDYAAKHGELNNKTIEDLQEMEVKFWGIIQKEPHGFAGLNALVDKATYRYDVKVLDTWVLPTEVNSFLQQSPQYTQFQRGGERAVQQAIDSNGRTEDDITPALIYGTKNTKIFFTRTFARGGENEGPENPLSRERTIGEWFPMMAESLDGYDGCNFKSHFRDITIYDEHYLDQYVPITFRGALAADPMFDEDGKLHDPMQSEIRRHNSRCYEEDLDQCFFFKKISSSSSSSMSNGGDLFAPISCLGEIEMQHFSTKTLQHMAKSMIQQMFHVCGGSLEMVGDNSLYAVFESGIAMMRQAQLKGIETLLVHSMVDSNPPVVLVDVKPDGRILESDYIKSAAYDSSSGATLSPQQANAENGTNVTDMFLQAYLANWHGIKYLSESSPTATRLLKDKAISRDKLKRFVDVTEQIIAMAQNILADNPLLNEEYTLPYIPTKSRASVFLSSVPGLSESVPVWFLPTTVSTAGGDPTNVQNLPLNAFEGFGEFHDNLNGLSNLFGELLVFATLANAGLALDRELDEAKIGIATVARRFALNLTLGSIDNIVDDNAMIAELRNPKYNNGLKVYYSVKQQYFFVRRNTLERQKELIKVLEEVVGHLQTERRAGNLKPAPIAMPLFIKSINDTPTGFASTSTYLKFAEVSEQIYKTQSSYLEDVETEIETEIQNSKMLDQQWAKNDTKILSGGKDAALSQIGGRYQVQPTLNMPQVQDYIRTSYTMSLAQLNQYYQLVNDLGARDYLYCRGKLIMTVSLPSSGYNRPASMGDIEDYLNTRAGSIPQLDSRLDKEFLVGLCKDTDAEFTGINAGTATTNDQALRFVDLEARKAVEGTRPTMPDGTGNVVSVPIPSGRGRTKKPLSKKHTTTSFESSRGVGNMDAVRGNRNDCNKSSLHLIYAHRQLSENSYRDNPTFCKRTDILGNNSIFATSLDRGLAAALLLTPFHRDALLNLVDNNIIVPINYLIFRPHMRYIAGFGVKTKAGENTGNTYINSEQSNFMEQDRAIDKTRLSHYSYESKAIVRNPSLVFIAWDIIIMAGLGGSGTEFYEAKHAGVNYNPSIKEYGHNTIKRSLFGVMVPYDGSRMTSRCIDASGKFSYFAVQGFQDLVGDRKKLHFSSAAVYNAFWGWRADNEAGIVNIHNDYHPRSYTINYQPKNTAMWRGPHLYYDPKTGRMGAKAGTGHFQSYRYPGCRDLVNGGTKEWIMPEMYITGWVHQ